MSGWRSRAAGLATRAVPDLDERLWHRSRGRDSAAAVDRLLAGVPGSRSAARHSHLVVIPQDGPTAPTWRLAGGNFLFEITQAAREYLGDCRVSVLAMDADESIDEFHQRALRMIIDTRATHVLAQVEADPRQGEWNWDVLVAGLEQRWDGVVLGLMFDSGFRWLRARSRRLARLSSRYVHVDICVPMDDQLVAGRPEIGPVSMPISHATLAEIDRHAIESGADSAPRFDVSFIGALYPYRVELLDRMTQAGINVAINPHRPDVATDFAGSRSNQPTYLDYMLALRRSRITINFSLASSGAEQQLKTRVLEATSMGCVLLTDDVDRTERFFIPGREYVPFADPEEIPDLVAGLLADPARIEEMGRLARDRARAICVTCFWSGVDRGLATRGLRPLLGA